MILLFDDVIGIFSESKIKNAVNDLVSTCRHYNIETIISVQHLKSCPAAVRDNVAYIIHTSAVSMSDLRNIHEMVEMNFRSWKEFLDYVDSCKTPYKMFVYRTFATDDGSPSHYIV
jgi:hypothetical protein